MDHPVRITPLLVAARPSAPPARWWRAYAAVALVVCAAAAALGVDHRIASWSRFEAHPPLLHELLSRAEPFGHTFGVLLIAFALWRLDTRRWWGLPRVIACAVAAGLAADCVKLLVARVRPFACDLATYDWAGFGGLFPFGSGGHAMQSFPSGHTAMAFGFALGLAWLYPRGRTLFFCLATLVACQRVEAAAHYLSDVLCGAAIGFLISGWIFDWGRLPTWFDAFEEWLRRPRTRVLTVDEADYEVCEAA